MIIKGTDLVHADFHDIDAIFVGEENKANPLGIEGLCEIGIVGTTATIGSAVLHATGKRVRELPDGTAPIQVVQGARWAALKQTSTRGDYARHA